MTRQEKVNWLANASVEQLVKQFETLARTAGRCGDSIQAQIIADEDLALAKAELLKRLGA